MIYTIRGAYPSYTITDTDGNQDTAGDFATIMKSFIYKLEPGDTIHWEEP